MIFVLSTFLKDFKRITKANSKNLRTGMERILNEEEFIVSSAVLSAIRLESSNIFRKKSTDSR